MNDLDKHPLPPAPGEPLLAELSRLQPLAAPLADDAGFEEKLLREVRRHRPRPGRARPFREALARLWAPVLLDLLFALLGWEIWRIIRYLLD